MLAIREKKAVQIEVTNACNLQCANCSRFVGHHKEPYFMDIQLVGKAIDSLEGFPGVIGIMGGEPTKHPQFSEICKLVQRKIPMEKRGLWTNGYKWKEYKSLIKKTFANKVLYNPKDNTQKHHPMLIAIEEVVEDKHYVQELVNKCWVRTKWAASINPKGCFFCEIAAALDVLFEGPGGHPIEKGWWEKPPQEFDDQIRRYCYRCSGALPFPPVFLYDNKDYVSIGNYMKLEELKTPKFQDNRVRLIRKYFTREELEELARDWRPWDHAGENTKKMTAYDLYGKTLPKKVKDKLRKIRNNSIRMCKKDQTIQRPI